MSKQFRIIDSAMFLKENYTPQQIESLKRRNIIDNRVVLAMEAKEIYDSYDGYGKMERYEMTAEVLNISKWYVIQLLKR